MNKEGRQICELEDNFVSLIDKFICIISQINFGAEKLPRLSRNGPRVPK